MRRRPERRPRLAAAVLAAACAAASAAIPLQPLVSPEVLEPSVLNEVEHALSRANARIAKAKAAAKASTNANAKAAADAPLPFRTNGLSATELAIRLVSTQRADGGWRAGTNDCTAAAVRILEALK